MSLDRDNTLWEQDLGIAHLKMGDAHAALREFAIANSEYNTSVKIAEFNWRRDKDNALWRNNLAYAYQRRADNLLDWGRKDEALIDLEACVSIVTFNQIWNPMVDRPRGVAKYCEKRINDL